MTIRSLSLTATLCAANLFFSLGAPWAHSQVPGSPAGSAAQEPIVLWMPAANGSVPANPIIGGHEPGRTLAVCRAIYNKGVHPGKVVGKNCNFGYAGKEVLAPQYEVLVGNPKLLMQNPQLVRWILAQSGQVPPGAFFGAYEPGRPILPICQAPYQGGVHIGKVVASNCNFGYGGLEVLSPQYAVLVVGSNPVMPATPTANPAATGGLPSAANPVAIAAAQNQERESTMAAVHAEALNLAANAAPSGAAQTPAKGAPNGFAQGPAKAVMAAPSGAGLAQLQSAEVMGMDLESMVMSVQANRVNLLHDQIKKQMQDVQAKNNAIMVLNTQLGELGAAKLKTNDPATLSKLDAQITEIKVQIDVASNTQQMDMLRLQSLSNKRNEAFELMTNFMKKMADGQSEINRNIR